MALNVSTFIRLDIFPVVSPIILKLLSVFGAQKIDNADITILQTRGHLIDTDDHYCTTSTSLSFAALYAGKVLFLHKFSYFFVVSFMPLISIQHMN